MIAKRPALKTGKRILNGILAVMCAWVCSSSAWAQGNPASTDQGRFSFATSGILFLAQATPGSTPGATFSWNTSGNYQGPANSAAALSGSTSLPSFVVYYLGMVYAIFRTFSITWLTFYGLFLGVQFAFAGASEEEIRNFFVGSCVVVGANMLASLYTSLFDNMNMGTGFNNVVPIQTYAGPSAYYCYVEKPAPAWTQVEWSEAA